MLRVWSTLKSCNNASSNSNIGHVFPLFEGWSMVALVRSASALVDAYAGTELWTAIHVNESTWFIYTSRYSRAFNEFWITNWQKLLVAVKGISWNMFGGVSESVQKLYAIFNCVGNALTYFETLKCAADCADCTHWKWVYKGTGMIVISCWVWQWHILVRK
jgi:hypothetical protein